MVPSFQLQCLYALAGRLEQYNSQTLSLLPVVLRQQLLLRLPVVDVCRLDGDALIMKGLDSETVWRKLFQEKIVFSTQDKMRETLKKYPTPKDAFLSEVSRCLLTCERYPRRYKSPRIGEGESKAAMIAFLLFGIRLESNAVSLHMFTTSTSLGFTWATPQRYAGELAQTGTLAMVKMFLCKCKWYPKSFELTENDLIDEAFYFGNNRVFQSFVSHLEHVSVCIDDYRNNDYANSLKSLWLAAASSKPTSFNSVSFTACVTNLGDLISRLVDTLFDEPEDEVLAGDSEFDDTSADNDSDFDYSPFYKFIAFKKLELRGHDGGTHPHEYGYTGYMSGSLWELPPLLSRQDSFETLIIEGFQNIVRCEDENRYMESESSYTGFEGFYNYLPQVIAKPSFKFLLVASCKVPSNTVKGMISTFLNTSTSHTQSLDLGCCDVVDKCFDALTDEYTLIKPIGTQCVFGEYKSLSIPVNCSFFQPQWLFGYPNLQLKRLELNYDHGGGSFDLQGFSECLSACPCSSINTLCINFIGVGFTPTEKDEQAIQKILQLPFLAELGFLHCFSETGIEDGLVAILNRAFSQPFSLTSLRRLQLKNFRMVYRGPFFEGDVCKESTHPSYVDFRSLFDTLFSMSRVQLAEFTLDLSQNSFNY